MAPRRPPLQRGLNLNKEGQAPPHDNGPEIDEVPNEVPVVDVNAALAQMANAITMQAGQNVTTPASRSRDFTRMNPPELYGTRVEEDPQEFIDQVLKVVTIMGVTSVERAECNNPALGPKSYRLMDISRTSKQASMVYH